ncbi:primase-helicase zinc-binding domain-containing protein [Devosia sp. 63-57]|uniref:DUF7146 domain-containing protein n=1 Tax=Devosia sp. 63-57 TaxID=1895751 RepID=UPI000869626A|nr:primase-helicase zinc-binding domain-containing protein [Devosia sp. 63-57]ODT50278.1 MAG: hypothetical protein ABS74_05005 [Pelagibacterium sp. SCN 63-126]ODU82742.1 MAG: hypothetical protein ABT14_16495 [Pelagibacterium sp. SCN 63-17]OJX45022.1 MAG: hypothetical protein BGO80_04005 [Devosia sp. 63-57]
MTLSPELIALRDDAMQTSCESWAIRRRWKLAPGIDRAGPCPVCGGTDRFAIHTKKNTFLCRGCGISGSGVIKLVEATESVGFVEACEIVTGRKASAPLDPDRARQIAEQNARDEQRRADEAARYREEARRDGWRIFSEARANHGRDTLGRYLALRGIGFDLIGRHVPIDAIKLWEHPHLKLVEHMGGAWQTAWTGPAMIAAVQQPDDRFGASHATWLDLDQPKGKAVPGNNTDTGKAIPSKKVRGAKKGGAIRLYTPDRPRRIVMGEGIETTLTALAHNFEADTAYWAGVDLGNMAGKAARDAEGRQQHGLPDLTDWDCFLPPDWAEELVYLCDSDEPDKRTVEKVTRGLLRAQAWRERRLQENPALSVLDCSFVEPIGDGKDLNDLVRVIL